jgi:hypothetical protein
MSCARVHEWAVVANALQRLHVQQSEQRSFVRLVARNSGLVQQHRMHVKAVHFSSAAHETLKDRHSAPQCAAAVLPAAPFAFPIWQAHYRNPGNSGRGSNRRGQPHAPCVCAIVFADSPCVSWR